MSGCVTAVRCAIIGCTGTNAPGSGYIAAMIGWTTRPTEHDPGCGKASFGSRRMEISSTRNRLSPAQAGLFVWRASAKASALIEFATKRPAGNRNAPPAVFDIEPLPPDHPYRTLERAQLSPHLGYVTEGNYRVSYGQVVEDIRAFIAGEPIRLIA